MGTPAACHFEEQGDEKSKKTRYRYDNGGKDFRPLANARGDNGKTLMARPRTLTKGGRSWYRSFATPIDSTVRVETALKGGLCLCGGVAVEHQRLRRRLQSLLPRPQGHPVPMAGPAEAGRGPLPQGRHQPGLLLHCPARCAHSLPKPSDCSPSPGSVSSCLTASARCLGFPGISLFT